MIVNNISPFQWDRYTLADPFRSRWIPIEYPPSCILLVPEWTCGGWRTVEAFHWCSWYTVVQSCWTIKQNFRQNHWWNITLTTSKQRRIKEYNSSKITYVEDFETSDIQYTNVVVSLGLGIKSLVDTHNQPFEHAVVDGLGKGTNGVNHLQTRVSWNHNVCINL